MYSKLKVAVSYCKTLWADYKYHRLAEKAANQLRWHSNSELKDIGITRLDINRIAHEKCGWCSRSSRNS